MRDFIFEFFSTAESQIGFGIVKRSKIRIKGPFSLILGLPLGGEAEKSPQT